MDKENSIHHHHQSPSLLPNNTTIAAPLTAIPKEESPRKPFNGGGGSGGGDRLKRDEWSEGAVSSLLEAYESKWVLRNRAKLKGHDWEDVARYVSSRANSTKSPKTQTQCKNKIESMKKRYRSESTTDASSWPLYSRLDLLLRGNGVAESIRWLAEAVVKSEQARMEAMREIERMRVEAEAKRAEMELKRTEIIANTQLEIAKLFASVAHVGKPVDSSLRIGRN
uniref:Myb/SANT-like DNA-binding domain-containing protein n=1 Tax=Cannabis sativa TaxID=3483 RepID=A0A803NSR5_CANSA